LGNPLNVVLSEEALIQLGAAAIGTRVAPAIEDIAPLAPATAGAALGLCRRGAVVDYPDLVKTRAAHGNLVKIGIVSHPVEVHPIGARFWALVFLGRVGLALGRLRFLVAAVLGHLRL